MSVRSFRASGRFERRVAATGRFSGDVGEDFAPLFIDAEHAGSPFEADYFEMPQ
jgi:hypothetical protein